MRLVVFLWDVLITIPRSTYRREGPNASSSRGSKGGRCFDRAEDESERHSVNPDAFFGVRDREKPEVENASYFFLEVVRSRASECERGESNFVRKMRALAAYYAEGRHREHYGIANFRVVTVTPTKQHARNLCEKLREGGLSSKRFLFTDLESISPDAPAKVLEKIFVTPKGYEQGDVYGFFD